MSRTSSSPYMRARPPRSPRSRRARNARVRRSALGRLIPPGPICLIALSLPAAAQRADQLPLAHLRAARDVAAFDELVELQAVTLLQPPAGLPAAGACARTLAPEIPACRLGRMRDRARSPRG